ncbi:MAG: DNA primase [Clostridia bacterium]|nr:DNA primase [Clostridia bacterium]
MYSFYTDEIIEEVRINNDIVDVVSEYVKLEKKGKDYFGLCPFHKEKTPSFSVVPGKQIFYCFGCGKGGNVVHFIMNAENLDFIESIKLLAERAKIQLPEGENDEDREKAKLKQEIIKVNTEAARFYFNILKSEKGQEAYQYFRKRGISDQTVRRFGLGYSSMEWSSLYEHLLDKGFGEEAIIKSGLVLPNKKGGYYDRFRGRVMFPIFDIRGNVIGFGGRVTDNSLPKYMNSPETPVYYKGRTLYAMNLAKNSGQKRIIIVEGYMDVISLHQCGIINTVASLGTALTESQGRILKKYAEEIIISYDADTAGQAATLRGLELLDDIGCNVKVLTIPEGKDPDEFIRKNGADAFNRLLDHAKTLLEYKAAVLTKQIDTTTAEGKLIFLNKISDLLVKVDNSFEREIYAKKLAKDYEISEDAIITELYKRSKPKANFRATAVNTQETVRRDIVKNTDKDEEKIIHDERMLLAITCTDNSVYRVIKGRMGAEDFINEHNRQIAGFIFERLDQNKGIVIAELLNVLNPEVAKDFARIVREECNCEDNCKAVLDIIKRIELFKLTQRQQQILKILSDKTQRSEGDVERLKQELNSIIIRKRSL